MPNLASIRHEKFAQGVGSGLSASEAYRRVTGDRKDADVKGDQWMNKPGVKARIGELRRENDRKSELSREDALRWLADLIRTPIGSVGKDSPLVQAYEENSEGNVKIRLADKIAGLQTLCRMTGWNEPEQVRLSGTDSLSAYLLELRAQPIGGGAILPLERHALPLGKRENSEEGL
jgi:Terminase small subunit